LLLDYNRMKPKKKLDKKLKVEDFRHIKEALGTSVFDKKIKAMTKTKQKNIETIFVKKKSRK
tara:strand:+ start:3973 stop:4158 length:186 start_codon:yes stop_codon:yes gene_type:complete